MEYNEAIHTKGVYKIVQKNGFSYNRHSGSHVIYIKEGKHISIPLKLESVIARRLILENNLDTNLKKRSSK